MRLAMFTHQESTRLGAVSGDAIADLGASGAPGSLMALLEAGPDALQSIKGAIPDAPQLPLDEVRLEAPIARPPKILAVGLNYRAHAEECGFPIPEIPVIFNKQSTSATGPFDAIHRPGDSEQLDYEGELAMVIGKRCRRVPREHAL